ncbi:MAG: YkgJ family cysteine cluster protein [Dehalococcoidia bacterium]
MSNPEMKGSENPCLSCGACCAAFRVMFYWTELAEGGQDGVPPEMTEDVDAFSLAMKGTTEDRPRCIALEGEIGREVHCAIYEKRPRICRAFVPSWTENGPNEQCDQARAIWGLPPLSPLKE